MQRKWCNSEKVVAGTDRDDSEGGPFSLHVRFQGHQCPAGQCPVGRGRTAGGALGSIPYSKAAHLMPQPFGWSCEVSYPQFEIPLPPPRTLKIGTPADSLARTSKKMTEHSNVRNQ